MGFFQGTGKVINNIGGGLAKGGIKIVSHAVSNKNEKLGQYLEEVGDAVVEASKTAVMNLSEFTDGTVQGAYGLIKKDEHHKQQGWKHIKDSTVRTAKGMGLGIKYTVKSTGVTLKGLKDGNREATLRGLKNLGKVAVVTTFAVGIVDIIDGVDEVAAEEFETRNDHLNGAEHPETGIPFVEKNVELPSGEVIHGTFPVFDSQFSAVLAEEMYLESDDVQFRIANETLYQSIQENAGLADELNLSTYDVQALANGHTPDGYVWHHNEQPGVLQLVDEETHQNTGHTGGREIWGGGGNFR